MSSLPPHQRKRRQERLPGSQVCRRFAGGDAPGARRWTGASRVVLEALPPAEVDHCLQNAGVGVIASGMPARRGAGCGSVRRVGAGRGGPGCRLRRRGDGGGAQRPRGRQPAVRRRLGRGRRRGGRSAGWGGPIPWKDPAVSRAGTVHVADSLAELTVTAVQLATVAVPTHPFLVAGQMTTADRPARHPAPSRPGRTPTYPSRSGRTPAGGSPADGTPPTTTRSSSASRPTPRASGT